MILVYKYLEHYSERRRDFLRPYITQDYYEFYETLGVNYIEEILTGKYYWSTVETWLSEVFQLKEMS